MHSDDALLLTFLTRRSLRIKLLFTKFKFYVNLLRYFFMENLWIKILLIIKLPRLI